MGIFNENINAKKLILKNSYRSFSIEYYDLKKDKFLIQNFNLWFED